VITIERSSFKEHGATRGKRGPVTAKQDRPALPPERDNADRSSPWDTPPIAHARDHDR
jgi:hypothetical protein